MQCQVKRGFFILRDCGEPAGHSCISCGRACCALHVRLGASPICLECEHKGAAPEASSAAMAEDDAWTYLFRDTYYRSSGYHPLYRGSLSDPFYDAYDVRAFELEGDDELDALGTPDLMDS